MSDGEGGGVLFASLVDRCRVRRLERLYRAQSVSVCARVQTIRRRE
jgi:hypothetical protein